MKKIIIGIILFIIILGIGLVTFVNVGKTYIEGTISGSLYASLDNEKQDIQTFFIRVKEKGTLSVILKWKSLNESSDSEIKLRVFDMDAEEIKVYESSNSSFAYINISDLGDKNYRDFKVEVIAYKGEAEYTLRVVKPGEIVEGKSSNLIENVGVFNIKVVKDNSDTSQKSWIRFKNLTNGLSNVKVKIFDKDKSRLDDHIFTFKDEEIDISEIETKLLGGEYTLILTKLDNEGLNSNELMTSGLEPVDLNTNFLNRTIQSGQTDQYQITLNGEKFIWIFWDKVVRDQEYPVLEIVLTDMNGKEVKKADVLEANSTAVLVVDELRGSYKLEISSQRPAYYALGIENQNYGEYDLKVIDDYVVKNTLESGNMFIYDLQFEDTYEKTIDIVLKNSSLTDSATVTAGIDGKSESIEIEADSQKTITLKVIPNLEQKYQLWVKSAGGNVSYAIDCDYEELKPKVTEETLVFDTKKLTYFSGNTLEDWANVDFVNETSISIANYFDLETIPLLLKKQILDDSGKSIGEEDFMKLAKWELTILDNDDNVIIIQENDCQRLRSKNCETDEIVLFQYPEGEYRLMVKWLIYDESDISKTTENGLKVGRLKGYLKSTDTVPYIESDIIINPPDLKKYNVTWINLVLKYINEIKKGIKWKDVVDWGNEDYHIANRTSKVSIPIQMVGGLIAQESKRDPNAMRYEPFKDVVSYHIQKGIEGKLMSDLKQYYEKSEYDIIYTSESKEFSTVFKYFWDNVGKKETFKIGEESLEVPLNVYYNEKSRLYGPTTWYVLDTYKDILSDNTQEKTNRIKKARKYLLIYLNYGPDIANKWKNSGMKDEDDPTKSAYILKNSDIYSVDTWPEELRTRYNDLLLDSEENAKKYVKIYIDYGKEKAEFWYNWYANYKNDKKNFYFKVLCDPTVSEEELNEIWNNIYIDEYEIGENKKVTLNSKVESDNFSPEKWLNIGLTDLKEYFDDVVELMVDNNQYDSEKGKKLLEYLIKYDYDKTKYYFEKIIKNGDTLYNYGYNPEYTFIQNYDETIIMPFIAQEFISTSYGLGQILFISAYQAGFRGNPRELLYYDTNLYYSLKFLATEKYFRAIPDGGRTKSLKDINLNPSEWIKKWNDALYKYNGGIENYVEKVRNHEKDYIK